MKPINILILTIITVLSFACTKESASLELEATGNAPEPSMTTLSNGPGCTVHLIGPCPSDCFASGGHHICLNPDHCNLHKRVTEIAPDSGGGDGSLPGNDNGNNEPAICDKCASCPACIDNLNGFPYARYFHTCDCGNDTCCKTRP